MNNLWKVIGNIQDAVLGNATKQAIDAQYKMISQNPADTIEHTTTSANALTVKWCTFFASVLNIRTDLDAKNRDYFVIKYRDRCNHEARIHIYTCETCTWNQSYKVSLQGDFFF